MDNQREIKFRAWDKACNSMLMPDEFHLYMNGAVSVNQVWATGDLILMQYTGMKDKNGVEIYEMDIMLSDEGEKGIVAMAEWHWAIKNTYDGIEIVTPLNQSEYFIVIGNIHQNSELLVTNG